MKDDLHKDALTIIEAGLRAADPIKAVENSLSVRSDGESVCVDNECVMVRGSIKLIGFGKASVKMAIAVERVLGDYLESGIIISPPGLKAEELRRTKVVYGDHPVPGKNTIAATNEVLNYCKEANNNDLFIVVISGGGSALFESPQKPITLDDLQKINELLLKSGADIKEINTVRKHISRVKGGRLAKLLQPSKVLALIISDVVGDPIEFIASGPTAPDTTTYKDARDVLIKYKLWDTVPSSVKNVILRGLNGELPETPKPGDPLFANVVNKVIASNYISLKAMENAAKRLGYRPVIITSMVEGEAREIGKLLAGVIKHLKKYESPVKPPAAVILGGETTVTVKGKGIGGRNQELALSVAIYAKDVNDYIFVSIGSDGIDGISDAAGGIVDGRTYEEATSQGMDPRKYLDNNDSHTLLKSLGRAIYTGRTGTNVNDLMLAIIR